MATVAKTEKLVKYLRSLFTPIQEEVLHECLAKRSGCMYVTQGAGKSLISLVLSLILSKDEKIIFVAKKSLVASYINEIETFLPSGSRKRSLPYEVITSMQERTTWTIGEETKLVIITDTLLAKIYSSSAVANKFVRQVHVSGGVFENHYISPTEPFGIVTRGLLSLYSRKWGCLIIDEGQKYSNIGAHNCQAISALFAEHRWILSGTPLGNPKPKFILGYLCLIDYACPRTLNQITSYAQDRKFKGLIEMTMVRRVVPPPAEINSKIIHHALTEDEANIYRMFKSTVASVYKRLNELDQQQNPNPERHHDQQQLRASLMAVIVFLRQSLVIPTLPLTNITLKMLDSEKINEFTRLMRQEFTQLELEDWLDSKKCLRSSRIKAVLRTLNIHKEEKGVLFVSHRTSVRILEHFIKKEGRETFIIQPQDSIEKRRSVIVDFSSSQAGMMILTYNIGEVGLNLQAASFVLLVDFEWLATATEQAIARINRIGQIRESITAYYFTCGAGVEKSVLTKQLDKKKVTEELFNGRVKKFVKSTRFKEFVEDIIFTEDTIQLIEEIYEIETKE